MNYRMVCLSQSLSPLTHGQGTAGNEQIILREPVICRDGIRYVPAISGNALRHRLVRRPLARHLCDAWELSGKITVAQLQFLFHGGTLTERSSRVSLAQQADLFRLFPFLRLLGCCLPG